MLRGSSGSLRGGCCRAGFPTHSSTVDYTGSAVGPQGQRPAEDGPIMRPRTIAIGDIHGCSLALEALLDAIQPRPDDVIVTLGDYVNRGPDSRGVLDRLIELERRCKLVPILGNHDEMLLAALARRTSGVSPTCWTWGRCHARVLRRRADHRGRPGPHPTRAPRVPRAVPRLLRDRYPHLRACAVRPGSGHGRAVLAVVALGVAPRRHPRPARLGQAGDRRPFLAEERRDPRRRATWSASTRSATAAAG